MQSMAVGLTITSFVILSIYYFFHQHGLPLVKHIVLRHYAYFDSAFQASNFYHQK